MKKKSIVIHILAALAALGAATPPFLAVAQTNQWQGVNSDWSVGTNWSQGTVPNNGEDVQVTDALFGVTTVNYSGVGPPTYNSLLIDGIDYANTGPVTLNHAVGNPLATVSLTVGDVGYGIYNLTGAATLFIGNAVLGQSGGGYGEFVQNNANSSVLISGDLILGVTAVSQSSPYSAGSYQLVSGTLDVTGKTIVGDAGYGYFYQDGGTHTTGELVLGRSLDGSGYYSLAPGAVLNNSIIIGDAGGGVFDNNGGTHNVTGDLILGNQATGSGTYNLGSGGTVTVSGDTIVGNAGSGTFNHTDGDHATTNLIVGNQAGSTGSYTIDTGTLTVASNLIVGNAAGATGTFTQNGGTVVVSGDTIIGNEGSGSYHQVAGDLTTNRLFVGNQFGSTGSYTIDTGTLTVTTDFSIGYDFVNNVSVGGAFTQNGGQVLNSGGFYIEGGYGAPAGTYTLNDGYLKSGSFGSMSNDAVFNHNGGQHDNSGLFIIANSGGSDFDTIYNITGATSVANFNDLWVGGFGRGILNQSGGTVNVSGELRVGVGPDIDPLRRFGVVNMTGGALNASNNVILGAGNSEILFPGEPGGLGTVNQTGGTVSIGGDLVLGQAGSIGGGTGYYNMDGGSLSVGGTLRVGDLGNAAAGVGEFTHNAGDVSAYHLIVDSGSYKQVGGTVTVTDNLVVGDVSGSNGQYLLSFTGAVSAHDLHIGESLGATGLFSQAGGATVTIGSLATTEGEMFVGRYGSGTYALSGGFLTVGATEWIGVEGTGTFEQSGGNNKTTDLVLGVRNSGSGSYNMSGGNLDVLNNVIVGAGSNTVGETGGTGTFTQTGGPVNVTGVIFVGGAGAVAGGTGTYSISNVNNSSLTTDGLVVAQLGATGTFNHDGGSVVVSGFLVIGEDLGAIGQYFLSDGTLTAGNTILGGGLTGIGGTGTFNQSGGTFQTGFLNIGGGGFTLTGFGYYNMTMGSLIVDDSMNIGSSIGDTFGGRGLVDQSGGSVQVNAVAGSNGGLFINNGTYSISNSATLDVANKMIVGGVDGAVTPGRFGSFKQMDSSIVTVARDLSIGSVADSDGAYTLSGTASLTTGRTIVGEQGLGSFTQSGGTHTITTSTGGSGDLIVGMNAGSDGTYNSFAGLLEVAGKATIGDAGKGTMFVGGTGVVHVLGQTVIGNTGSGVNAGLLQLDGGGSFTGTGQVIVAANTGSEGGISIAGNSSLKIDFTGTGAQLLVGDLGSASVVQSGSSSVNVGSLRVGVQGGSTGVYTMNGGTLDVVDGSGVAGGMRIGLAGSGTFTQGAGTTVNAAYVQIGGANFGQGGGGTGVYNLNGGTLVSTGTIDINVDGASTGTLKVAGGSVTAPQIINRDQLNYSAGAIAANVTNYASFNVSGGAARTLTGSLTNNTGGTTMVAASTPFNITGALHQNGGNIVAGSNIVVGTDYTNTGFGSGNSFDRRAGVSGAGQIQGLNASQTITATTNPGALTNTGTNAFTLDLGVVRGGTSTTVNYQIANNGSGADIRGAIQTSANGGSITDARLSGSGVTAGNFGPIAAGGNSGSLGVTFNAASGGGALSGQTVAVYSNFENVATQVITITGGATTLANGSATPSPGPVSLGNFRVGATMPTQQFAVENTVSGSLAERLGIATPISTTGNFSATSNLGGGFINPGSTQANAMSASVLNGVAGVNSGSMTVQYTTNGQAINASFGTINANQQTIGLTATGYNAAAGSTTPAGPVNLGNVRVGGTLAQSLTVSNTAAAGSFSEDLNASFGTNTGHAANNGGTISGLLAGSSNNAAMSASLSTASAGAKTGTVTINYETAGAVNGVSNGLGTASVGSQTITLNGNVYNAAAGSTTPAGPVNLGNVRVGGTLAQSLTVSNTAAAGSFSEDLNASFGANSGHAANNGGSISGLLAGGSNNAAMSASLSTASAGAKTGTVTINYETAGAVNGTSNGLGTASVGSQTITLNGNVYNAAAGSTTPAGPVVIANQRVGGSLTQALTVENTAPVSAFTEKLNASFGGNGGQATNNGGSVSLLAAGAQNNASMRAGVDTSSAGAKLGTVTINYQTDGTGTSGLAAASVGSQTINVSGNVFQAAAGQIQTPTLNFGNVQVNQAVSQDLVIRNIATGAAGYVEDLNAAFGTSTDARITGTGTMTGVLAGSNSTLANGTMTVNVNTASSGNVNGTIQVLYETAGKVGGVSNGLGTASVGSENYGVIGAILQGNVIDQAKPVINGVANPGAVTVNFGNVRVNAGASQTLTVENQATGGVQAYLNASIASNGAPVSASGSFTALAPGSTNPPSGTGTPLQVALDTSSAGARSGSATVSLVSDITSYGNCSPNCTMDLPNQTVNVSANVFKVAAGDATPAGPVNLGNVRVGGALAQTITVSNTATGPAGFVEDLNASFGTNTGQAGNNGGSITGLAAGASNGAAMSASLNTASAGAKTGTVTINYDTAGTVNGVSNGLGTASVGSQTITLNGNVYNAAVGSTAPAGPVNLGNVRVGGALAQTFTVSNTAPAGNFSEDLNASFGTDTGHAANNGGSITGLVAGNNNGAAMAASLNTASAGAKSGTVTINYETAGTVNGVSNGLGTAGAGSQTITLSGGVFEVAQPDVPASVNLGNFRLGSAPSQAVTIGNTNISPAGYQEGLDAAVGGTSGKATASGGPIGNLAAGSTSNAITVGINNATAAAGANAGTVTLNLASNGTGTSGLSTLALADAVINVSGTGWNMANGQATPSPVNLGNFRVGQAGGAAPQSQDIAVSNTVAGPFTEGLGIGSAGINNAAFTLTNNLGSSLIAAGGSNATALNVARTGGVAGVNSGTLSIQYTTDGAGTSGLAAINANGQDITVNATGYLVAQPNVPVNVNLGNVRLGSASQAINISNTNVAGSFQEGLNASTGALGGQGTASGGPITNLAPGGSSNAISVGLSGIVAGTGNAGTVQINLASNGTASGLSDLALASQTVNVSATGYRLANPQIDNPLPITLAARVGDAVSANTGVSISNVSPDQYTEGLNVSITGASGNVQHNAGAITNLAAQGTSSNAILIGLASTAAAGTTASQVDLKYVSTGTGTTGAPDQDIGTGTVTVNSKVYTAAVGTLDASQSTSLNFGTVRVGTPVSATLQNVTVKNAADVTSLNDTLTATLTTGSAPFQAFSTVSGIGAGQTNAPGTLKLGMNTGAAGSFTGNAQVAFKSVNPDMADLDLAPSGPISLQGTVNALANPVFGKTGGAGSFGCVGLVCTLDFGTLFVGSGGIAGILALTNDVPDPADDLLGDFVLTSLGDFMGSGFGPVNLAAGASFGPLQIGFDALTEGMFSGSFLFSGFSHNAFQADLALNDITVLLRANVVRRGTVPEPGTMAMILLAATLLSMTLGRRRKERRLWRTRD